MAPRLRRHQLISLSVAGWQRVLDHPWDDEAYACIRHWAECGLPLVVTRQPRALGAGIAALGLPTPLCWSRRRLGLQVPLAHVLHRDEFPLVGAALTLIDPAARPRIGALACALARCGVEARVYGSYGWQLVTGLAYLHPDSDLDLWLPVSDAAQADAATACLSALGVSKLRVDGELGFPDGSAIAWSEWADWRAGRTRAALVKHIDGVGLLHEAHPLRHSGTTRVPEVA